MEWIRPPGAAERLTDIALSLLMAAASSFFLWAAGAAPWVAAAAGGVGAVFTLVVLDLASRGVGSFITFQPGAIEARPDADDELLLDDRLALPHDSRVVRLFAPDATALPGELAARIDDWLVAARTRTAARSRSVESGGGHGPGASPASAALHAALAGIKQSLR